MKFLTSKPILWLLILILLGGGVTMAYKNYQARQDLKALNALQEKALEEIGALKEQKVSDKDLIDLIMKQDEAKGKKIERLTKELAIKPTSVTVVGGSTDSTINLDELCPTPEPQDPTLVRVPVPVERELPVTVDAETTIAELKTVGEDLHITGFTDVAVVNQRTNTPLLSETIEFEDERSGFFTLEGETEAEDKGHWWFGGGFGIDVSTDVLEFDNDIALNDQYDIKPELMLVRDFKKRKLLGLVPFPKTAAYGRIGFGNEVEASAGLLFRLGD